MKLIGKDFKKHIVKLKRKYLHWKWQRRWLKAWTISCRKAYGFENIKACSPWYYFWDELESLKNNGKGFQSRSRVDVKSTQIKNERK